MPWSKSLDGTRRPTPCYLSVFLRILSALTASSALSKAKYATLCLPIAAPETPRRLIPASASARVILTPSPARSGPETRTEWTRLVVLKPASFAARVCFAPRIGVKKTTPLPGLSGARLLRAADRRQEDDALAGLV